MLPVSLILPPSTFCIIFVKYAMLALLKPALFLLAYASAEIPATLIDADAFGMAV